MGDAQSAQREEKRDAAAEGQSGEVDDAQAEQNIEDKPLKNNGQISEINGKADGSIAEVNGHCEDEIAAEAILSPDEDVTDSEKPLQEAPLENVEMNEKVSPKEDDANEDVVVEMTEMDAKQNDINEGFKRFFSNIGLKLTVKRGSSEIPTDMPAEPNKEQNIPEDIEDTAKETKSENAEQNTDVNMAQETCDNDSTTCPTLTDGTPEDILETAGEKTTETKEEGESDNAGAETALPVKEDAPPEATPEDEPQSTSPPSVEEEVVVSPIKRFFTTGIFSGLRKKKKSAEDETTEKELVDLGKKEDATEQTARDQQQDKEEISLCIEAAAAETEHEENEVKAEILSAPSPLTADEGKSSTTNQSTNEAEILGSQEKEKVQASPLKRLLSGSSFKKLSKKPRSRKSSDAKLSDSGEHVSDHLQSSTETAENQKEGAPAQPAVEAAAEEDSAWASFKKLVTPKRRMKNSSLPNEETPIPVSVEEPKPSEPEHISDHSTEEGKKRKDSSVSWEAVLCGSGRRRSRKTSDSEEETPQIDKEDNKQDGGPKHGAESPLESSNEKENEMLAASPKQEGSPPEGDAGSTWKSLKRLVTPKRKAKDEEESKDNIQSDNEITQDESTFSIKKLIPGRKKRKSADKQDQVSSDEADKEVTSSDEDSETPAVVPLSEFETAETEVHIQTQADVESHIPKEADSQLQQDLLDQMAEPVLPCETLPVEAKEVQDDDAVADQASTTPAPTEEPDDLTEIISKHQQLSDIPEEGIITETMATPASVTEEAVRDDTIAEDLIEITSEAITAPEPASDLAMADETEMISAVSQLSSESSKTSGNTTPVPAEYDIIGTDALLHQVVETMATSPNAIPICSDNLSSERAVGSVSHQILETFVKEEPTVLEIHRRSDATAFKTGLNAEELDAVDELRATAQTESISEVNDSISTEVVSEVLTEEFDTAEITTDEVHEVSVTHPEESIIELERRAAASTDLLPEADESAICQVETEPLKLDSQETDAAITDGDETKGGALEQEVETPTEKESQIVDNVSDQIQVEDKDQPPVEAEELQEFVAVQAAELDLEGGDVRSLEEQKIPEDLPETETADLKEETVPATEVSVEPEKEDELERDAAKTEQDQESGALEPVQAPAADLEEDSVQLPEEEVKSEDITPVEAVTNEPKQTDEQLREVSAEPENKEQPAGEVETEPVQEPEVVEAPNEEGSVQSLERDVISEDVPQEKTPKTEDVQEPQDLQDLQAATAESEVGGPEKEEISEDTPEVETVTDEPKEESGASVESEEKTEEDVKTEDVHGQEDVPSDAKDIAAEIKTEGDGHVVTEGIEEDAQTPEKQILIEDLPEPDSDSVTPSVTEDIESDAVAPLGQALIEDEQIETIPQNVRIGQEDHIPEVVDDLQTLAIQLSTVNEVNCNVQVLEKTVFAEETPAPCVDSATVLEEPKHEVHLGEVQLNVEAEKERELPGREPKTTAAEHAVVPQVVQCDVKQVSTSMPHVLIEKASDSTEPLIDTVANELLLKEQVEVATPLLKDDVAERAEEGSVVMMMRVPSLELEDNHRIQVQVVDFDVKSAETTVDSVLEVGVTQHKEVIDVCHETVENVDYSSATPEIQEEIIQEENKVTIQEVIQHVKESLSAEPETVAVVVEQEAPKQPDAATEVNELTESASAEAEDQKAMDDSVGTSRERQDEIPAAVSDDQQASEDLTPTSHIAEGLDVSSHDGKKDLEETKAEWDKSEAGLTAEDKSPSEELDVKTTHEHAQITQMAQTQIATRSNTGLVVPQNTGIISSVGNVESPSSLSLEFKLNIQFGQTKAPVPHPLPPERTEPVKQTDASEVKTQAAETAETVKPTAPTQTAVRQKEAELTEAAVQATEITEPAVNLDSSERAVIATHPALLDVGVQAMEAEEPTEPVQSTEKVTASVQATETTEPAWEIENTQVLLSQAVLSETCAQQTKTEEPAKQTEEENDQDVWMDAEEVIYTQEETEEEFLEPQTESEREEKEGLDREVEMAPNSKTEQEGEGQPETHKTGGTCEIESEGEDFAIALEHPEISTANITTMEWD